MCPAVLLSDPALLASYTLAFPTHPAVLCGGVCVCGGVFVSPWTVCLASVNIGNVSRFARMFRRCAYFKVSRIATPLIPYRACMVNVEAFRYWSVLCDVGYSVRVDLYSAKVQMDVPGTTGFIAYIPAFPRFTYCD